MTEENKMAVWQKCLLLTKKKLVAVAFLIFYLTIASTTFAQEMTPAIGAEVFIEPGQTPEEIDTWFKRLKEANMTVTRIRMFEDYMRKPDGTWDYTLFDHASRAADKYGIKIYFNLFPSTFFTDVGGFKFPKSDEHLQSIATYIKNSVTHFKQFKSCYGWVPINEPVSWEYPKEAFSLKKFEAWKALQPVRQYKSKGYVHFDFADERFLVDYNTWFLKWLTDEIHKYAPGTPVHVNPAAVFQSIAEYDFPEWRKFLTSLGASAHASWHFGYFNRNQYALAVSATSEIIRSGAGNLPWFMTELQGGNNTYSGFNAMCPTKEEISQWLWTTLGTEGKGAIFWCLNPRSSGFEAGEWAMLDFQNEPTDRMKAAAEVAGVLKKHDSFFRNAKVAESGINILYTRESLWIEKKMQVGGPKLEGSEIGGVVKSALGYFEALSEMGLQANFKSMDEFDFSLPDYTGKTIILVHQVSIPSAYWPKLESFVSNGGKLLTDGLTGYYDENALSLMNTGFPMAKLFGGTIAEYKLVGNFYEINLGNALVPLPAHLWRGTIKPTTTTPFSKQGDEVYASRNKYSKGEVLWVPTLVGLAARMKKDYKPLAGLLEQELQANMQQSPFRFEELQPLLLMKTLKSGKAYVTVLVNKSTEKRSVDLVLREGLKLKPMVMFSDKGGKISNNRVDIAAEETLVIHWK